jgi:ATP-dependent protease ClpP protease subunit
MLNQIKLYGVIGEDVTAVDVKTQLDAMDQTQPLLVRIHSEGGSVPDGLAIYDAMQAYPGPKKAIIESAAFSIASHIAMAFEEVEITENGYLMIHNPHMEVSGDDTAHAQAASVLSKMKTSMVEAYRRKTGKSEEEVLGIMAAESWINAKEALAAGYVNRITAPRMVKAVARSVGMPQGVIQSLCGGCSDAGENRVAKRATMSDSKPVAASLAEIKAAFPKAKADFIVACLEKQLPMASVMTEALGAMEEEMVALRAKVAEYEQKMAAMETKPVEGMEEEEPAGMEEEEEEVVAKVKAKAGVKPLAKSRTSGQVSAKASWDGALSAKVTAGMSRPEAIRAIEKECPGLRESMIEEVNQARKGA